MFLTPENVFFLPTEVVHFLLKTLSEIFKRGTRLPQSKYLYFTDV
jgi:hypothetical protein